MSLEFLTELAYWTLWAGAIAGGLAVALTSVSAYVSYKISDQVQEETKRSLAVSNARIAEAHAEAAKGNERAAEAVLAAAKANERAAEAELALERYKAPRTLSPSQESLLRDRLSRVKGVSVDIFQYGDTHEIVNFGVLLGQPLKEAGWSPRTWSVIGGGAVVGALVMTRKDAAPNVQQAASNLLAALQAAGVVSRSWPAPDVWKAPGVITGPPWSDEKAAPIRILLGSKP